MTSIPPQTSQWAAARVMRGCTELLELSKNSSTVQSPCSPRLIDGPWVLWMPTRPWCFHTCTPLLFCSATLWTYHYAPPVLGSILGTLVRTDNLYHLTVVRFSIFSHLLLSLLFIKCFFNWFSYITSPFKIQKKKKKHTNKSLKEKSNESP